MKYYFLFEKNRKDFGIDRFLLKKMPNPEEKLGEEAREAVRKEKPKVNKYIHFKFRKNKIVK